MLRRVSLSASRKAVVHLHLCLPRQWIKEWHGVRYLSLINTQWIWNFPTLLPKTPPPRQRDPLRPSPSRPHIPPTPQPPNTYLSPTTQTQSQPNTQKTPPQRYPPHPQIMTINATRTPSNHDEADRMSMGVSSETKSYGERFKNMIRN